MNRKFSISLNEREIEKTINSLKKSKEEIRKELKNNIERILLFGKLYAKEQIVDMNAIDFGELLNSIEYEISNNGLSGRLFTDCKYAKFVEYGTGIVGKYNPAKDAPSDWIYDLNNHKLKGWIFYYEKIQQFIKTFGMIGRPFWLNTQLAVEEKIRELK
jgi:hypothetical protein